MYYMFYLCKKIFKTHLKKKVFNQNPRNKVAALNDKHVGEIKQKAVERERCRLIKCTRTGENTECEYEWKLVRFICSATRYTTNVIFFICSFTAKNGVYTRVSGLVNMYYTKFYTYIYLCMYFQNTWISRSGHWKRLSRLTSGGRIIANLHFFLTLIKRVYFYINVFSLKCQFNRRSMN